MSTIQQSSITFEYIDDTPTSSMLEIPSQPLHIKAGTSLIRHPKSHRTVGNCQATSTMDCPFEYIDSLSSLCIEKNGDHEDCKETPSDYILQSIRESLDTIKKIKK
jgi:hypothetical protein